MNFGQYLPDTEARIKRLGELVKSPVGIILPGSSVEELDNRIEELKDVDICWAGVNEFWNVEKILAKISERCSVVLCAAQECDIPNEKHIEYLERENNMFLSVRKAFQRDFDTVQMKYDDRLLFFVGVEHGIIEAIPDTDRPLHFRPLQSLALLILLLTIAGAKKIVLFGADGGKTGDKPLYYGGMLKDSVKVGGQPQMKGGSLGRLLLDARVLNENFPQILRRTCKLYEIEAPDIINCSPESNYEVFRKVTYDEAFSLLS